MYENDLVKDWEIIRTQVFMWGQLYKSLPTPNKRGSTMYDSCRAKEEKGERNITTAFITGFAI